MSNIGQSFQAGKAEAQGEYQAEHAAQCVKDTAGAAADSAQLQQHRATGTVEQVAQTGQGVAAGVKDTVAGAAVGVTNTVAGVAAGVTNTVTGAVAGVTNTVTGAAAAPSCSPPSFQSLFASWF
uniref:Uncharacterized protein n=1 Tax=Zea mays TaxID=4577 RepID=B6UDJ8_MAIZE|nr:hypothetical protein [Zea mays]